ncbi:dolichyl-phosphate beta-glucosyltransferase [Cantharellus anzutake]|uniref:dolichyl-phosphate beta-glucosyltransferase n=1 Tax=Cantharellus anzutake TaxID=1750568 RepID=UPI0019042126|nr:dolichyl-phosphate beta-glucosyltransferase [Cantharellus anzutake]KAF8323533.1 dolichyl-phosphate beta-glucosyltransferase [Cantharellus anzutake]
MVDADGASNFSDVEKLWDEMDLVEKNGHAISVGSRHILLRSVVRNLLMHALHFILRTLGVGHVRDTQCGFKLFARNTARALFPTMHISHWIFDVEILLMADILNIPVVEVPVGWHEVPGSKINLVTDSLGMLRDLLILRANYAVRRWSVPSRGKSKID